MDPAKIEINVMAMATAVLVLVEILAARLTFNAPAPRLIWVGTVRLVETALLLAIVHYRGPGLVALGLGRCRWLAG